MNNGLYFSFGSVGVKDDKVIVGLAHITGALSAGINTPLVKSMGGGSSFPVAARPGRSEGELTLTLNQRPPWVDELLNDGSDTDTAAAAAAAAGTITNVKGNTLAGKLTVAVKSGAKPAPGVYQVTAESASSVKVVAVTSNGIQELTVSALTSSPKDIGSTGLTIASSGNLTATNAASFEVTPAHGGITTITVPQVKRSKEYSLVCYSAPGAASDNIEVIEIPRVMFSGADFSFTDNEPGANGLELTGVILAPNDGGSVFTRKSIAPVA